MTEHWSAVHMISNELEVGEHTQSYNVQLNQVQLQVCTYLKFAPPGLPFVLQPTCV